VTVGQKWLRAGWSTGFLYASARALERLEPALTGWTGVRDPARYDGEEHPPAAAPALHAHQRHPIAAGALAMPWNWSHGPGRTASSAISSSGRRS